MPTKPLTDEILEETIRRIEICLTEGYSPPWMPTTHAALKEAGRRAVEDGFTQTFRAFETRYLTAKDRLREPDWTRYRAPVYQAPAARVAPLQQYPITPAIEPSGRKVKVCVIGDAHDDPRLEDKTRFLAMGRWANEEAPDYIVQVGDWATFDSMSRHAEKGSLDHKLRPSWQQDLESLHLSIGAFEKGLKAKKVVKIFNEGNHEERAWKYESSNPDMVGTLVPQWQSLFASNGWRIHGFGEYAFIEGVGFIHYIVNGAGKAFGGKTGNQRAGNDSTFSIVHGHDHRLERVSLPKIGPSRSVEILSIGCSLPWGHVEPYAKLSPAGWWWGVNTLTIQDGMILGQNSIEMPEIMRKYGK